MAVLFQSQPFAVKHTPRNDQESAWLKFRARSDAKQRPKARPLVGTGLLALIQPRHLDGWRHPPSNDQRLVLAERFPMFTRLKQ